DTASRLGLSLSMIDQTLYDAFGQRQVATIYTSSTQYKVVLEAQPEFTKDPTSLSRLYVPGANGAQVPLSTVAHFTNRIAPLTVSHQGQFPAVGRRRRPAGADDHRLRPQRHRLDRDHPADRHRQEERDHDDRLRARGRTR